MHYVIAAQWIENFKVLVTFDDHVQKTVVLEGQLEGPIFEPLRDVEYFKTVHLDSDIETIVWDNGANIAPEFLYQAGTTVGVPTPGA